MSDPKQPIDLKLPEDIKWLEKYLDQSFLSSAKTTLGDQQRMLICADLSDRMLKHRMRERNPEYDEIINRVATPGMVARWNASLAVALYDGTSYLPIFIPDDAEKD